MSAVSVVDAMASCTNQKSMMSEAVATKSRKI